MDKCEIFRDELNLITNYDIREIVENCLNNAPDYFYEVPASSSGKYHSKQDLGHMGLIRHTKTVVWCAIDLLRCEQFVKENNDYKDVIVASCLLHDIKTRINNYDKYTTAKHPLLGSELFMKEVENTIDFLKSNGIADSELDYLKKQCGRISNCIKSHMGIWNRDYKTKEEILPKPSTKLEVLVHLADYIASRKYINMYDLDNNKIN